MPGVPGSQQASPLAAALLLAMTGFSKPTTAQPTWMTYDGQATWNRANDQCTNSGGRLCTLLEYCPDGMGGAPNQSIPGNSNGMFTGHAGSAPTSHYFNDWVKLKWHAVSALCVTHVEEHGTFPEWGLDSYVSNYPAHAPAFCCCLGCAALVTPSPTPSPTLDHETCSKIVYCKDGKAYEDGNFEQEKVGKSCADECEENCCVGDNACTGGGSRFKVCADENDGSCNGPYACHSAGFRTFVPGAFQGGVGLISGGSCVGERACNKLGDYGTVGSVSGRSCRGTKACHSSPHSRGMGRGKWGNISNGSCQGTQACYGMAMSGISAMWTDPWSADNDGRGDYPGGEVGDITGSCKADHACEFLRLANSVSPGPLHACCNSPDECKSSDCTSIHSDCDVNANPVPADCIATPAPTPAGPWIIGYDSDSVNANFSSAASNEFEVGFFVGVGREVEVDVTETCDADADPVPSSIYTKTVSPVPAESNLTHSKIIVGYKFDEAEMINSTLWNDTIDQLNYCQVTSLVIPDPDGGDLPWVIAEDRREIGIKFDLTAKFNLGINLTKGTIKSATQTVEFGVNAYKCQGGDDDSFDVDATELAPSTQLAICVKPVNDAVVIADVANMALKQDGATPVPIIDNDSKVVIQAITTKNNEPPQGTIVKTMVPLSTFSFDIGKFLNISGTAKLQLNETSPGSRKLRALVGEDDQAVGDTEESGFALSINLRREVEGFGPIGTSDGHAIVGKGLVVFGLAVVAAIGLVM